jgi:predicted nuclease of restriction endonuclease-like (RecB) superfamily
MEMGKGFALVDRQKRIHTEKEDYYIDMVFYNYNLRSFVLIDLLCCAQHNYSYVAQPIMLASNPNSLCA